MTRTLHIDFVSDIVCPWCVVGLGGLETALATLKGEGIEARVHFQPFELNPGMAPRGRTSSSTSAANTDRPPNNRRPTGR